MGSAVVMAIAREPLKWLVKYGALLQSRDMGIEWMVCYCVSDAWTELSNAEHPEAINSMLKWTGQCSKI